MKIFEIKTSQKLQHQLKERKATNFVKASNQATATQMLKSWFGSLNESSLKILSCRELSGSAAKNINAAKLITPENYNRWKQPGNQTKKPASKNGIDWQTINKLEHNKEVDGVTDEEINL